MSALPAPVIASHSHPLVGLQLLNQLSVGRARWWAGAQGGRNECVNGQSFVPSSGYHSNISAEMEFEFQKV